MALIEEEVAKKSKLVALVSLMETPNEILDKNLMLEVVSMILSGFATNIASRKDITSPKNLERQIKATRDVIKGELKSV